MPSDNHPPVVVNARFLTQPITGVQRFAIEICKRLVHLMPQVKFVAPGGILHPEVAETLGVETYGTLKGHLWEQVELPLYLRGQGQKPLLVNLCNTGPLFYQRKLVCIHDLAFLVNPGWFSRAFSTFYRFLIPLVARGSERVLTVSNFSRETIIKYLRVPESEVVVLYNAVSDHFKGTAEEQPNRYGNYILAVGSLDPRKNLKTLVKAFNACHLPDLRLVIVGAASKIFRDAELQALVQENPAVIFTGYLSDEELVSVYQNAKLFVYPSLYEGFGIPPLEAMSCGCATVVSATSSLPEVCGKASYYIDPSSSDDIARAIKLLLGNDQIRRSLVEKGYARSSSFTWEGSARKLADIIQERA